jgi:hypothetical protein
VAALLSSLKEAPERALAGMRDDPILILDPAQDASGLSLPTTPVALHSATGNLTRRLHPGKLRSAAVTSASRRRHGAVATNASIHSLTTVSIGSTPTASCELSSRAVISGVWRAEQATGLLDPGTHKR